MMSRVQTLLSSLTKRVKLKCDPMLSSFAFYFNLRRYMLGTNVHLVVSAPPGQIVRPTKRGSAIAWERERQGLKLVHSSAQRMPLWSMSRFASSL
jgi:hypothetical protein